VGGKVSTKPRTIKIPMILGGGQLDLLEGPLGSTSPDELGLVEADHGLGQGVVVAVTAGADRSNGASLG
jgi:hypothetical protein